MRALLLLLLAVPAYAEWTEDYMADRMDRNRDYQAEVAAEERHQEVMRALRERPSATSPPGAYGWMFNAPPTAAPTRPSAQRPTHPDCVDRPNPKARAICTFLIENP